MRLCPLRRKLYHVRAPCTVVLTDDEGRPRLPVGRTDELLVLHRGVDGRTRRDQCQDTGQHSIPEGVLGRLLRSVLRR